MADKFKGVLLGLIVGDALGATFEGMSGNNIEFEGKIQGGFIIFLPANGHMIVL